MLLLRTYTSLDAQCATDRPCAHAGLAHARVRTRFQIACVCARMRYAHASSVCARVRCPSTAASASLTAQALQVGVALKGSNIYDETITIV